MKSVSAGLVFPCGTECREDPVGKLKREDVTVIGGLSKIDHASMPLLAKAGRSVVLVSDRLDQWTALPPSRV